MLGGSAMWLVDGGGAAAKLKSFGFGIALGAVLVLLLAAVLDASALGFQSSCPSSHRARAVSLSRLLISFFSMLMLVFLSHYSACHRRCRISESAQLHTKPQGFISRPPLLTTNL